MRFPLPAPSVADVGREEDGCAADPRALLTTLDRRRRAKVHEEDKEVKEVVEDEEVMEQEAPDGF